MILLALTTLIAGTFFGACLYVTLVEHPARIEIGTDGGIKQFRASARRAAVMQGGLSVLGLLLGLVAINKRLLDPALDGAGREGPELLVRWGRLHGVRTVLGGFAFGLMMFRLLVHAGV